MLPGLNRDRKRAISLMELLLALVLLSMVVLGISNIEVFSKFVFMSADRKAKSTNEACYVIEHMSKFIGQAVGDAINTPVIINSPPAYCTSAVQVWMDNVSRPPNGIWDSDDRQILYCFNNTGHTMTYYSNFTAGPGPSEVLSRNVADFIPNISLSSVEVNITCCWNASISSGPRACGSVENPRITLRTSIFMPSVSVNAN